MLSVILLLCLVPASLGYPSGPPVSTGNVCTNMIPADHNGGVSLATDLNSPPYTITTNANSYTAGGILTVTVTGAGATLFRGLLVQARRVNGTTDVPIGTFSSAPSGTKLLMCNSVANSAWGHANADNKTTVTAMWNAPTMDEGTVQFRATIVKGIPSLAYFYLGVVSSNVDFMGGDPITASMPTQPPNNDGTTPSNGPLHSISFILTTCALIVGAFLAVMRY